MAKAKVKYEDSAADKKSDRAGAKKAGIPVKEYEGSAADIKADAKMVKAKAGKALKRGGKC